MKSSPKSSSAAVPPPSKAASSSSRPAASPSLSASPDLGAQSIELHRRFPGKTKVVPLFPLKTRLDLALAYTPGVAAPCRLIQKDAEEAFALCGKRNRAAIITDGTRVLGLGDIGPLAALPVMEGKAMLMNSFGRVDAIPLCLAETDEDKFVAISAALAPSFGALLLEDIASPKCFRIEKKLQEKVDIPVFHDDQHGTAIVALAGLINALKVTGRDGESGQTAGHSNKSKVRIIVNGAGAAGHAIALLLHAYGFTNIVVADSKGSLHSSRSDLDEFKKELAAFNPDSSSQPLVSLLVGADVFIGASAPGILTSEHVRSMAKNPIVFAMANPIPEISQEEFMAGVAARAGEEEVSASRPDAPLGVYGSGRSDTPNQINNLLAFPGLFRGLLDSGAVRVSHGMKIAAAEAIARTAQEDGLEAERIVPDPLDSRVHKAVAKAVAAQAKKEGLIRK